MIFATCLRTRARTSPDFLGSELHRVNYTELVFLPSSVKNWLKPTGLWVIFELYSSLILPSTLCRLSPTQAFGWFRPVLNQILALFSASFFQAWAFEPEYEPDAALLQTSTKSASIKLKLRREKNVFVPKRSIFMILLGQVFLTVWHWWLARLKSIVTHFLHGFARLVKWACRWQNYWHRKHPFWRRPNEIRFARFAVVVYFFSKRNKLLYPKMNLFWATPKCIL